MYVRLSSLTQSQARKPDVHSFTRFESSHPEDIRTALEGDFPASLKESLKDSKIAFLEIGARGGMATDTIAATVQGVWPGINSTEDPKAAPSGAPWIDTNSGFLKYARAATDVPVWIANAPPTGVFIPVERYLQTIGDAAMTGARWVFAFDANLWARLEKREPKALAEWKRINGLIAFLESHKEWRGYQSKGNMAVVQDASSGALLSGGILDMIAVRHTPVRPVPVPRLSERRLKGSEMAVNVDPASLTDEQKAVLRAYTRGGGTLLQGPPGWKMPSAKPGEITLAKEDLDKLDAIWKEMNTMTGRKNLGARLFNVASMLSNFVVSPDGKQTLLHLVNYSNYAAEAVTIHLLGSYKKATLLTPDDKPKELAIYPVDEGVGVDIEQMQTFATLVLE